jgi:hypothetical protein
LLDLLRRITGQPGAPLMLALFELLGEKRTDQRLPQRTFSAALLNKPIAYIG